MKLAFILWLFLFFILKRWKNLGLNLSLQPNINQSSILQSEGTCPHLHSQWPWECNLFRVNLESGLDSMWLMKCGRVRCPGKEANPAEMGFTIMHFLSWNLSSDRTVTFLLTFERYSSLPICKPCRRNSWLSYFCFVFSFIDPLS